MKYNLFLVLLLLTIIIVFYVSSIFFKNYAAAQSIYTDPQTECQYYKGPGYLTPRLGEDGRPICKYGHMFEGGK